MSTFKLDEAHTDAMMAGADLSDKLYRFAKLDTAGKAVICGSGETIYGVIHETAVQDAPVSVMTGGIAKVVAGAAVAKNGRVMSDGNGAGITATSGSYVAGVTMSGATKAGVIMDVNLTMPGRAA